MPNFLLFRSGMLNSAPRGEMPDDFIRRQYKLLKEGIRDVRIHDAACISWLNAGGKW